MIFFPAKMSKDNVCGKFVRSYNGEEVHKCLARANLAPKLMSCERLLGGWVAVIMENVDGVMLQLPLSTSVRDSLMEALDLMDRNNYVHGDFRKQNILVVNNRACIVDFDWAGIEVNYPPELQISREHNWDPGVKCGGEIKKEHDRYQVFCLLEH